MPNVNYRGKPSQDPNAPPESGVTSIPLGAPWPPLSREQVVKLHEGLVAFRGEMEASKGIRSHEDQQDMIWGAAVELDGLLVEMGIGSPPPTRTWTHEEVAKVAEEVQNLSGRELKAGEMVTTAQVQVEPPKRNCWTCKHDFGFGHTEARYCRAMPARKRGERDSERHKAIGAWTNAQNLDATLMPPKDSDGCPGWEPKP